MFEHRGDRPILSWRTHEAQLSTPKNAAHFPITLQHRAQCRALLRNHVFVIAHRSRVPGANHCAVHTTRSGRTASFPGATASATCHVRPACWSRTTLYGT